MAHMRPWGLGIAITKMLLVLKNFLMQDKAVHSQSWLSYACYRVSKYSLPYTVRKEIICSRETEILHELVHDTTRNS